MTDAHIPKDDLLDEAREFVNDGLTGCSLVRQLVSRIERAENELHEARQLCVRQANALRRKGAAI